MYYRTLIVLLFVAKLTLADPDTDVDSVKLSICTFKKASSSIQCNSTMGTKECQVDMKRMPKNFTLFAIGETKAVNVPQELVWFRLYPRKVDNSGWWYYKFNRNSKMALYPKEKDSINDVGFIVLDRECWSHMNMIIRAAETFEIIKTEKFSRELFAKSYYKVKMIGMITTS